MTAAGVRRRRPGSLRFRVSAVAVVAVIVVLTGVGAGLVLAHRATLLSDLDENLARQADVVAARLRAGEQVDRGDLLTDDFAVLVSGAGGAQVAGAPGLAGALFRYGPPPPRGALTTVDLPGGGGAARVLFRQGSGWSVWAAGPMDDVRASTAALVRSLLLAVPAGAAFLAALVWWAVGRALRPVEAIRAEVDRITGQHLTRRVPEPRTSDEIARLARTMNAMLARLQAAAEQQRRFVADASHELRSPLARIRTQLEVDRAHPESADQAATQATVLVEAGRLQRLVDDLLLLARGDAGALDVVSPEPVDLDAVVAEEAAARRTAGPPRIDLSGVTPVQVWGSRRQLERAVGNLLDNAVRHGRDLVTVTLTEDGEGVALAVTDDGAGLPPGAEDAVFERFTRLDGARTAQDGGAGLGLAIARDVAVRHGGTLTVDTGHHPGARLLLVLPGEVLPGGVLPGEIPPGNGVSAASDRVGRALPNSPDEEEAGMASVQEAVDVDVPIKTAYDQWTQFESFPQFMGGVERITQLDDRHNHWVTNIDGVKREFDTEVTEQHPEERIAWTSTGGEAKHAGVVTFHKLAEDKTRVMIQIDWEPGGLVEKAGAALGFDDRQVKADARRFKEFIESRGAQTGAWRGEVPREG